MPARKMAANLPDFTATTSDGKKFTVRNLAEKFTVFRDFYEHTGSNEIELSAVNSDTLRKLLAYADAKSKAKVPPTFKFADLREALRYLNAATYLEYDEGVPAIVAEVERLVRLALLSQIIAALRYEVKKDSRWGLVREMADYPFAMVKLTRAVLESRVCNESVAPGASCQQKGDMDDFTDEDIGVGIPGDIVRTLLGKAHPRRVLNSAPEAVLPWSRWLSPVALAKYGLVSVLKGWRWNTAADSEGFLTTLDELAQIIGDELSRKRGGMFGWLATLDPIFFAELEPTYRGTWTEELCRAIITKDNSVQGWLDRLGLIGLETRLDGLRCAIRERNSPSFDFLIREHNRGTAKIAEDDARSLLFQALASGDVFTASSALQGLAVPAEALLKIPVGKPIPDGRFFPFDDPRITPAVAAEIEHHYRLSLEELRQQNYAAWAKAVRDFKGAPSYAGNS